MAACPKCGGSGVLECHRCKGAGKVKKADSGAAMDASSGAGSEEVKCPSCHGVGTEPCSRCDGSGEVHC